MKVFGIPKKDPKEGRETWEESEEKAKEVIRTNLKTTPPVPPCRRITDQERSLANYCTFPEVERKRKDCERSRSGLMPEILRRLFTEDITM